MFELVDKNTSVDESPVNAFRFKTWDRFQNLGTKKVRYTSQEDNILALSLPQEISAEANSTRKSVSLESCLVTTFSEDVTNDYFSDNGQCSGLKKSFHMGSFPDYLIVQIKVIFNSFNFC